MRRDFKTLKNDVVTKDQFLDKLGKLKRTFEVILRRNKKSAIFHSNIVFSTHVLKITKELLNVSKWQTQ